MQQFYTFRFLSSPEDPRYDGWIGQTYGLSYLNSEPGNNFLFSYKPYELMLSRIDKDELIADRVDEKDIRTPSYAFANKRSWSAPVEWPTTFAVKPILETIVSRNFYGVLDDVTAFIVGVATIASPKKDKTTGIIHPITTAELEERINTYVSSHYTTGYRRDWLKETLHYHLINSAELWEKHGVEKWIEFADLRFFPREAIDVGVYLNTFINKLRDGVSPAELHLVADMSRESRQKAARNLYPSIMMDLSYTPFINTGAYSELSTKPEEFAVVDHLILFGDDQDKISYRFESLDIGIRPDQIGHIPTAIVLSERPKHLGHHSYGIEISERPEHRGLHLGIDLEYGETIEKNQYLYAPIRLMEMSRSNLGHIVGNLHLSDKKDIFGHKSTDRPFADLDLSSHAMVYPMDNPKAERHGANASIPGGPTLVGHSNTDQGYVLGGYIFIDGAPYKDSYITERVTYFEYTSDGDGYISDIFTRAERHGANAFYVNITPGFEHFPRGAWIEDGSILVDSPRLDLPKDAWIVDDRIFFDIGNKGARIPEIFIPKTEKTNKSASPYEDKTLWATDGSYNMDILQERTMLDGKIQKHSTVTDEGSIFAYEKINKRMRFDHIDLDVTKLLLNSQVTQDISAKVDKLAKHAWYIHMLTKFDRYGKASMIVLFWEKLQKVAKNFRNVDGYLKAQLSEIGNYVPDPGEPVDPNRPIRVYQGLIHKLNAYGVKNEQDVMWVLDRLADYEGLEGLFTDLIGWADIEKNLEAAIEKYVSSDRSYTREIAVDTQVTADIDEKKNREALPTATILANVPDKLLHETILPHMSVGEREEMFGIVQNLINAHNEGKEQRPGYIPEPMLLVQDRSQWDDIWNRYSPGIDLIDVPNSDYDYSKLASQVYDPVTGVPHQPLSPTNVPDVIVPLPLHHPLPQNYDLGTDEVFVDNYVIIDSILAINTLMERSKLRYAGMPAEEAMRELFSKLFAWIQQISPGNPEYDRMFRFSRWYAETCVIKLSKHILHRTYNPWKSELHLGNDLGLSYTATNWQYIDGAYVLQTTGDNAMLSFDLETYIDGNATFRGYLDNPFGAGVLEVYIDGDLKTSITNNGPFQTTVECLQGDHIIDFIFNGTSGRASLSSMEIDGAKFVSAYTSSDDKNTNGLKAMTTLIKMLLSYYDLHHGDGKIKGSKELKQRKLFNWQ